MIEHVKLAATRAVGGEAANRPFAQRDAAGERPALDFQRGQGHLNPHAVKDERFPARASAPALSDLQGEAGSRTLLQSQHLEAELMRAGNVGQRLARILLGMKYAETLGEI